MEQPLCKTCRTLVTRFIKSKNQWWEWCSNKCMSVDPEIVAKKAATNQKRFGGHPMTNPECREKLKEHFINTLGVDNPSKSPSVKQKMKHTFVKNYGVDNPSKNQKIIEKIKEKAISRDYASILEKRKTTNLSIFGVTSNKYAHLTPNAIEKLNDIEWLKNEHINHKKSCDQIAKELGCSPTPILTKLSRAGVPVRRFSTSGVEDEIQQYIKLLDLACSFRDRTVISPKELDIVSHLKKFAVEINGIYWHSELCGKDKWYHLNKTEAAAKAGYELWHVFDSEWETKQEIIKSRISGKFGMNLRIPARKCVVRKVETQEKTKFLVENHLQGAAGSKINLGLYYNNELVALATFGKSRFDKTVEWELVRFCNKLYTNVQGGASKLLSAFIRLCNPKSIISYADRRFSTGELYNVLGFKKSHISDPNYWYFLKGPLESRQKYQKHKLKELFENFNSLNTEWEIMQANGYNRIWDCGNIVYIWKKDES